MGKKAPLGEGTRFRELSAKLKKQGVRDPDALSAAIGRKKFGNKKFAELGQKGKR